MYVLPTHLDVTLKTSPVKETMPLKRDIANYNNIKVPQMYSYRMSVNHNAYYLGTDSNTCSDTTLLLIFSTSFLLALLDSLPFISLSSSVIIPSCFFASTIAKYYQVNKKLNLIYICTPLKYCIARDFQGPKFARII